MLTRMHGKRLTAYKRIGFTNPVIGEIPLFPAPRWPPQRQRSHPNPLPSRQRKSGRGRRKTVWTSPPAAACAEIWDQYRVAHLP